MRTIKFLLGKEFKQIFRNKAILRIIFIMPLVQLLILPLAANYEVKNIRLSIVDQDMSSYSRQLVEKITASGYFNITDYASSYPEALKNIARNKADIIIQIPPHFERNYVREQQASLLLAANAIDGIKGVLGTAYLQSIIAGFNNHIRMEWMQQPDFAAVPVINISSRFWYNPHMKYSLFMVPGILALLVTLVGSFLAALNIVSEKESGTIEQINVTPIKKYHFILGKLIPFWILAMVILTLGFLIAWLAYGIVPVGSYVTIYLFSALYLLALLGLGLLISTLSSTQQQAMLIAFFIMMTFVLLSGLFTPIESMPVWAQYVARFNPVTYFIALLRGVILKGSTLNDVKYDFLIILLFAIVFNTWAVLSYRKRST